MPRIKGEFPTQERRIVVDEQTWELLVAVAGVLGRTPASLARDAITQGAAKLWATYEEYWIAGNRMNPNPHSGE